ncbi:Nicastrin-domain-containing protein [Gongronella butleri]|nr:Nicastrin-domain-containing protein [Gongronella butleri]
MTPMRLLVWLVGIWVACVAGQDMGSTVYPMIYTNLYNWPCTRLLNSTSTLGCQAPHTGSGVLYLVNSQSDIDTFLQTSLDDSFAIILPYSLLTLDNIATLENSGRVTGLLVQWGTSQVPSGASFRSPDSVNPNHAFGLYASDPNAYVWNQQATEITQASFNLPIFAIEPFDQPSTQVYTTIMQAVQDNQERNYVNYPLQAVDFNLMMWAAVNAETCLRRGWCLPVGGMSVYSTPSSDIQPDDQKPIVVLSAAMDSNSLFRDLTVGVGSSLSGLVTLLAVADALSRSPQPLSQANKHVLFTAFTAEPWGFAGSQRFLQDISSPFVCTNGSRASACQYDDAPCTLPCVQNLAFKRLNAANLDTVLEFGSIGTGVQDIGLWAHVDDPSVSGDLVQQLVSHNNETNVPIQPAYTDGVQRRLPPSSAMSFLKKNPKLKAAVVTGYQKQMNSYYNSDIDDQMNNQALTTTICGLATASARTVYDNVFAGAPNGTATGGGNLTANCNLISELLDCLSANFSCAYMQQFFNVSGIGRISHYSSVYTFNNPQPQDIPRFVLSYLGLVNGHAGTQPPKPCQSIADCPSGQYCFRQQCTVSMTYYHPAYGTGLHFDETRGQMVVADPTQPTFTESTWDEPSMRIFLVSSRKQQHIELVVGILWTLGSVAVVFAGKRFVKKRFKTE